jgi:carboxylesterase type B
MRSATLFLLVTTVISVPLNVTTEPPASSSSNNLVPIVKIANGTVVGLQVGLIEDFKGIPFAEPPIGPLRLKPPQPLKRGFGTFYTQIVPNACPQFFTQVDRTNLPSSALSLLANTPFFREATVHNEDCLSLNVQRPAGTNSSSKLPVVVWYVQANSE